MIDDSENHGVKGSRLKALRQPTTFKAVFCRKCSFFLPCQRNSQSNCSHNLQADMPVTDNLQYRSHECTENEKDWLYEFWKKNIHKHDLVNKPTFLHCFSVFIFVSLYIFLAAMCPSSGDTTVFMRHLELVILCGWLSGMQGGMKLDWQKCPVNKM